MSNKLKQPFKNILSKIKWLEIQSQSDPQKQISWISTQFSIILIPYIIKHFTLGNLRKICNLSGSLKLFCPRLFMCLTAVAIVVIIIVDPSYRLLENNPFIHSSSFSRFNRKSMLLTSNLSIFIDKVLLFLNRHIYIYIEKSKKIQKSNQSIGSN